MTTRSRPAAAAPGAPPTRECAVLPFYSSEVGPEVTSENYLIFFGSTDRRSPYAYHETRYFWPFWVQGRGQDRVVDRWGPFYTYSLIKGVDKRWYLWPLLRRTRWADGDILQDKVQFLYFLFWHQDQHSARRPAAAPAEKTYLWPLVSTWDNAGGRQQMQVFSPLEGVLSDNDEVRQSWSPFFAVGRDDRRPDAERSSLFWNAVTWSRQGGRSEFHLGPLFSVVREPAGTHWRFFGFEFAPRRSTVGELGPEMNQLRIILEGVGSAVQLQIRN